MSIIEKIFEIYREDYVCPKCLGRLFSVLGSGTTNEKRGEALLLNSAMEAHRNFLSKDKNVSNEGLRDLKILSENANFLIAQNVLRRENIEFQQQNPLVDCYLCQGIFNDLNKYAIAAHNAAKEIEYENFLIGCSPHAEVINREDQFKSKHNLIYAESLKTHFNREVGKIFEKTSNLPVEFKNPDIVFIFDLSFDGFSINTQIKSLFVYGRYKKLIRGIPQSKWFCRNCRGAGCEECDGTGRMYPTSVEEKISESFLKNCIPADSKFHGGGREDVDVRTLGNGRPFVLEIIEPKIRKIDLEFITKRVNKKNKNEIEISDLKFTNRKDMIKLKAGAEFSKKTYSALVEFETDIVNIFEGKLKELRENLINTIIVQKTPTRVLHRRADLVRKKKVFEIGGKIIDSKRANFSIKSIGGTYIKELIDGDEGRTSPSFSEIFGIRCKCIELDVINIEY